MITVLIAEDELLVRMGMLSMVNWEKNGMSVIACVSDGTAALRAAREHHPDIIITDIVMPGMDGITLLRELRREGITAPGIVITALHHKQAMESAQPLGIVACLVKATMTQNEINAALTLAKQSLEIDPERSRQLCQAELNRQKTVAAYLACLPGRSAASPAASEAPRAGAYILGRVPYTESISSILGQTLSRMISELFAQSGVICSVAQYSHVLLALEKPVALPEARTRRLLLELRQYSARNLMLSPEFAVYSPAPGDIPAAECIRRLEALLDSAEDAPVSFYDSSAAAMDQAQRARCADEIEDNIWALCEPEKIYALWQLAEALRGDRCADAESQQGIAAGMSLLLHIKPGESDAGEIISRCRDALAALRPSEQYHREISASVRLMLQNLDREIKLSEAAHEAGFHEVYFSSLFKQQLGTGFSKFSGMLRIERAKDMLRNTQECMSQISEKCGYRDVPYFSRVFKQFVGMSPAAWKEQL